MRFAAERAVAACVTALIVLGSGVASASPPVGFPEGPQVSIGERSISLFLRYPDMGACQAAYYSNCFRFADGTVVGQINPLSVLIPVLNLLGVPWGGCDKVAPLGASTDVVEVYAGEGFPLVVGSGGCGELMNDLAAGRAYLAAPGVLKPIPPTAATVLEMNVATR